jgi:hypothetical protein
MRASRKEAFVDQPKPWLRYVDAGDVKATSMDFDGMDVESPTGEHLGDVDGFIVDADRTRPYYVVVDAGGWFKTRHFLLPVGHAGLVVSDDGEALVADLTQEQVEGFPGFDKDEFEKLSDVDFKRINDEICLASAKTSDVTFDPNEPYSGAWNRPDYRYPDWWTADPVLPDRMGERAVTAGAEYRRRETARHLRDTAADDTRDDNVRKPGDESPHFAGRAQPGDVLGIETGGEQTHVGETAADEDKRREEALKSASKK